MKLRRLHAILVVVGIFAFARYSAAGPHDLTFTIIGTGGVSLPQTDVSRDRFWWINTDGPASPEIVLATGFVPFNAFSQVAQPASVLFSDPFTLRHAESLEVTFALLSALTPDQINFGANSPEGFALLLQNGQLVAVLANTRADGRTFYNNEFTFPKPLPQDCVYTPPSAGVTITVAPQLIDVDVTLGGHRYAPVIPNPGFGYCGCELPITASVTPGAGTYQLLFGIYDFHADSESTASVDYSGALVVSDVRTKRARANSR